MSEHWREVIVRSRPLLEILESGRISVISSKIVLSDENACRLRGLSSLFI